MLPGKVSQHFSPERHTHVTSLSLRWPELTIGLDPNAAGHLRYLASGPAGSGFLQELHTVRRRHQSLVVCPGTAGKRPDWSAFSRARSGCRLEAELKTRERRERETAKRLCLPPWWQTTGLASYNQSSGVVGMEGRKAGWGCQETHRRWFHRPWEPQSESQSEEHGKGWGDFPTWEKIRQAGKATR